MLGYTVYLSVPWIADGNIPVNTATALNTSLSFSTPGVWLIQFCVNAVVSAHCDGTVVMQPSDSVNFISGSYSITNVGSPPNIYTYASGAGVKTITASTSFVLIAYITSIPSGTFFSRNVANNTSSFISFTRVG